MSRIRLVPFISKEQKDFSITRKEYEEFVDYIHRLWEEFPLDFSMTIEAARDFDDDRVVFRDVKFRVMSRYRVNGDRLFSGDNFTVNVDELLRLIERRVA